MYGYALNPRPTEYKLGDRLTYQPFGGGTRTGTVVEKSDDIKNGRPGFVIEYPDASEPDGIGGGWGYDDQIVRVVAR
jgi:hypothetical protein